MGVGTSSPGPVLVMVSPLAAGDRRQGTVCVTSSGFESILEPAQGNAGFYFKPSMKHSSKIALAIATSATTIKAEEM